MDGWEGTGEDDDGRLGKKEGKEGALFLLSFERSRSGSKFDDVYRNDHIKEESSFLWLFHPEKR